MEGFRGRSDQLWRGIEVRKTLGEVDRPIVNPFSLSAVGNIDLTA